MLGSLKSSLALSAKLRWSSPFQTWVLGARFSAGTSRSTNARGVFVESSSLPGFALNVEGRASIDEIVETYE